MNAKQSKIVKSWLGVAIILAIWLVFYDWFEKNMATTRFLLIALIIFLLIKNSPLPNLQERSVNFNNIIDNHPWVKLYTVIYSVIICGIFLHLSQTGIDILKSIGTFGLFATILGVVLPVIIIGEIEKYKNAGKQI